MERPKRNFGVVSDSAQYQLLSEVNALCASITTFFMYTFLIDPAMLSSGHVGYGSVMRMSRMVKLLIVLRLDSQRKLKTDPHQYGHILRW